MPDRCPPATQEFKHNHAADDYRSLVDTFEPHKLWCGALSCIQATHHLGRSTAVNLESSLLSKEPDEMFIDQFRLTNEIDFSESG